MVAAVVFLIAYAIPIVLPQTPPAAVAACEAIVLVAWVLFALDYACRLVLAPAKWTFVKRNAIDLAAVALPVLRPLRLLRLMSLVSVLNRTGARSLRGRVATYTVAATALIITVCALAITDAERGEPGANITSFPDGLWWAVTTITTVGYGDRFPVSVTGRLVAVALMVGGIALLGIVAGALASWLLNAVAEVSEAEETATRAQVDHLTQEVAALRSLIEKMQAT